MQSPMPNAYPTFFSTNDPTNVLSGFSIFGSSAYESSGRPNIICLNDDVPELERALGVCSQGVGPYAFTISTNIFLCPAFFDKLKAFPENATSCPTVDAANPAKFADHNDVVVNQYAVLTHEIVHVFTHLDASPNKNAEVYGLNEIIASGSQVQSVNANNYAYYAACVFAGCQSYPTTPTPTKMVKRGTADANSIIPAVFDDYIYNIDFDFAALAANLTALGKVQLPSIKNNVPNPPTA